jgi:hypothetical protein
MSDLPGMALVITALTGLVTAIGVIYVSFVARKSTAELVLHGQLLKQVERQGNSASLELKRMNMVFARRAETATVNISEKAVAKGIADDAEMIYMEAKIAAERDGHTT